jgi:hypothetical protein
MRAALLVALAGCILPVSTGAPLPPTTVGRGRVGVSVSAEAPVLDLIASNATTKHESYTSTYAESAAAATTVTLAIGLGDDTDLELSGDGALYDFLFPIPTGAAIGVRRHLLATCAIDVGVAARVGAVTSGATTTDASRNATADSASAYYGAAQVIAQRHDGVFRPLLALDAMPFQITRGVTGEPVQHFAGLAASATLGLFFAGERVQAGPYVTATSFASQTYAGGSFVSGGLMLSVRR